MTESGGCVSEGITESFDRAPFIHVSMRLPWFTVCPAAHKGGWVGAGESKHFEGLDERRPSSASEERMTSRTKELRLTDGEQTD